MKAFVTGATGFLGGRLVSLLRERGDDVVALVRDPKRAERVQALGCSLVVGDLSDVSTLRNAIDGCDSVFHLAGDFRLGILKREREQMRATNVEGTANVLAAAREVGVSRIVYASTIAAFGDTQTAVVDETFERDVADGFTSTYDETKFRAHEIALDHIDQGAPIVIVQPGAVYGPNDHSDIGNQILLAGKGELFALMLTNLGINLVHVDDVANGMILAHDKASVGRCYVLGGENVRLIEAMRIAADASGKRLPRITLPPAVIKAIAPVGPYVAPRLGYPPNLNELVRAGATATYWASSSRAERELGYTAVPLEVGIPRMLAASGVTLKS